MPYSLVSEGLKYTPLVQSRWPLRLVITLSKSLKMSHSLLSTARPPIMLSSDDLPSTCGRCDFDLPPNDQIPFQVWNRRSTWRSNGCTGVLYSNVGDGRSSIDNEHRRAVDGGRTCRKTWRDTSQRLQARSNNKDRHLRQPDGSSSTHDFSQREPGCICLKSWRNAKNWPFNHGA